MKLQPLTAVAAVALAAALFGCARSPKVTFYVLEPGQQETPAPREKGPSVSVGPVTIPEVNDRQQLVVRSEKNRVDILELHRWAAPLKGQASCLLADQIARRIGSDRVSSYPQTPGSDAEYRVLVDIQRLDVSEGEGVSLEALWTVKKISGGSVKKGRFAWREPVPAGGYDALVAALGRGVAAMSEDIAKAISAEEAAGKKGL